ncbi:MAG: hypothetical protein LBR45_04120 [Bacteroidales bacterium]|jgi:hypothetical protein|nr:hypothetical protein [Bacteroidales bacterium]
MKKLTAIIMSILIGLTSVSCLSGLIGDDEYTKGAQKKMKALGKCVEGQKIVAKIIPEADMYCVYYIASFENNKMSSLSTYAFYTELFKTAFKIAMDDPESGNEIAEKSEKDLWFRVDVPKDELEDITYEEYKESIVASGATLIE